jgi:hypothetical protein
VLDPAVSDGQPQLDDTPDLYLYAARCREAARASLLRVLKTGEALRPK